MNIVAIIPARGGSKRLPRKNIKLLAGKPLIAYVIRTALLSKSLNKVIVSTEDSEIKDIARQYGAEVIKRPKALAKDSSTTIDVIFHAISVLEKRGEKPDVVVCLQPTSPLQAPEDIDNAIGLFLDSNYASVISVCDGVANGAIYVSTPKILNRTKSFYTGNVLPYRMSFERSVDIDTEEDFKLAENIFKKKHSFIIAEAGVNHDGRFLEALRLVDEAVKAGADAIKFQTFYNLGCLEKYELTRKEWRELKEYCDSKDIEFMTTPHWGSPHCGYKDEDYNVIDFVDELVKKHKVASPYLTNRKYLEYIASKKKPILLSTGSIVHDSKMATLDEVERALSWIPTANVTLLHCISEYPLENRKLERVRDLRRFLKVVGLSDHSKEIETPPFPVIEKHFMVNENCIDANVSLNPQQFKQMVKYVREQENFYSEFQSQFGRGYQ